MNEKKSISSCLFGVDEGSNEFSLPVWVVSSNTAVLSLYFSSINLFFFNLTNKMLKLTIFLVVITFARTIHSSGKYLIFISFRLNFCFK